MGNISKMSQIILLITTSIWSLIMITVSILMYLDIGITSIYSFEVWIEFTKAIFLWYIISYICAFGTDIANKKADKT